MAKVKKYDVIVIGAGGGAKIVRPAAERGYKVAVIEKDKVGGTCLNRGCIPSKMIIHPANVIQAIKDSRKYNVSTRIQSIDFAKVVRRVSKTVDEEAEDGAKKYRSIKNIDYYACEGRFVSDNVILVNGKHITAKKIFIAVGARPSIPPIPGLCDVPFMTSTEALRNTKLPKKLIVIGGGYIGCELGYAYASFGSDVHFIVRSMFLRNEDKDVREEFTRVFTKHHKVSLGYSPVSVSMRSGVYRVVVQNKDGKRKTITGDGLLVASGVTPNTDLLGLENTSIRLDKRGYICVNRFMETSVKGVYALGDVIGKHLFRHSVNFEGEYLFDTHFGSLKNTKKKAISYPPMPHAVFSHPEIAGVGKTEDELITSKAKYASVVHNYKASAMGMARMPDHGFVKLLFDKKSRRLLGAHIIGEEAATMVHHLILGLTLKATVDDLLSMIYIHPALPEIVRNALRKAKMLLGSSGRKK